MFIQKFKESLRAGWQSNGRDGSALTRRSTPRRRSIHLTSWKLHHRVQQSPSVKQAQQQVVVAEARLKDAKREVVPDLQLRAGEQANLEQLPEAPGKKTGAQSFASAGIELPLWNRNQGNTRAAEARAGTGARQEVTRTQLSLRQQAEVLAQNYLSAKIEAERYRTDLLPRARQAYQLYLEKYQSMAQAYPQVIVSQRTLFELEVHYIDSLDRSWQNAIALENFYSARRPGKS